MKATVVGGAAFMLATLPAFGADLGLPLNAPPPPLPFTWTSCYAGVHAGGGWGQKDMTDTAGVLAALPTGLTAANLGIDGYMLGGQIGCDYQFSSRWVLGIEGSASGGNIGGTTTVGVPAVALGDTAAFKDTTDFLASITGRVGYSWDRLLLYGKGGVAYAGDRYHLADLIQTYSFDAVENRLGWTAGAGLEWALWDDWSIKLEYDYYGFGSRNVLFIDSTLSGASGPLQIKQNVQLVTLGLNFHAYPEP